MKSDSWYEKSFDYWRDIEPSIDGVLGGLGSLNEKDIDFSREFLFSVFKTKKSCSIALDVGAGIGRISKNLLLHFVEKVSLIEPNHMFVIEALKNLNNSILFIHESSIAKFNPNIEEKDVYDIMWIQWILIYVSDACLLNFLKKIQVCLKNDCCVIVKENVSEKGYFDNSDHSYTRTREEYEKIFLNSGYTIEKCVKQEDFPNYLFPVYMWCLKQTSHEQINE